MFDRRLFLHLVTWLGQWPAGPGLHVVGSRQRTRPGWDGQVRPVVGVGTPTSTLVSVPVRLVSAARLLPAGSPAKLVGALPKLLERPDWQGFRAVFRSTRAPAPLPDAGEWV
ncbi:GNAT family N-acetyltransferase, partial [Micromonospora zhanjiangensis]